MTDHEQIKQLRTLLIEILDKIKEVYQHSAYYQQIDYAAKDGKDNWLSRAQKIIEQK